MTEAEIDAAVERLEAMLDEATRAALRDDWTEALLYLQESLAVAKTLPTKPGFASPADAVEAALGDLIAKGSAR